jgi:hypothetical protein
MEQGDDIGTIRAPPANFNQLSGDRTDHLVAKGRCLDLKANQPTAKEIKGFRGIHDINRGMRHQSDDWFS